MMHTVTTHTNAVAFELRAMFDRIGEFIHRNWFKPINLELPDLHRRLRVLDAIIDAGPQDWRKLTAGQRRLLLAVLHYEARRLEGTWVGEQGTTGQLRFPSKADREHYQRILHLAIAQAKKGQG